jgi:hypothetical protein
LPYVQNLDVIFFGCSILKAGRIFLDVRNIRVTMSLLINAYSTVISPSKPEFEHEPHNHRDRSDPEMVEHLQDFIGYVMNKVGGEMTATAYHVMRHIERVQNQFSLTIEEDAFEEFAGWALAANAIFFLPDGTIRDPYGAILVDPDGDEPDPEADVPYPQAACERKLRTETRLQESGIPVLVSLPPVIGESELVLRDADEVARRMLALFLVAVRAESLNSEDSLSADELRETSLLGFDALTPNEREFMENVTPDETTVIQFVWRYEALFVLQWALGLIDKLPFPTQICNVPQVAGLALKNNSAQRVKKSKLRPTEEILDALDLHFRLHWAARNAKHNDAAAQKKLDAAGLEPGVIQERHYALNWLVRFEDKDWDDVDTPT